MKDREKKKYVKPEITRVALDNTISLVMMSNPGHGHGHGHDKPPKPPKPPKGAFDNPFDSPFN